MAHNYDTVRGIGKDREDAESAAVSEFLYENGRRHDVRDVESPKLIRKVPPKKRVEEERRSRDGRLLAIVVSMVDDPEAPPDQWLEEWEFVLHTHS